MILLRGQLRINSFRMCFSRKGILADSYSKVLRHSTEFWVFNKI